MNKPKIMYVVSSWSGPRAMIPLPELYIQKHINQLNRLKHQLSHVSIGWPHNPNAPESYCEYLDRITSLKDGTPVTVHKLDNNGRSYGQWSKIYEKYRQEFDYYIFIEDDYVPCMDHFDSLLVDLFKKNNCGYLCGLVLDETGRYGHFYEKHAGISNGIASKESLEKVYNRYHMLPHDKKGYTSGGQIKFSNAFTKCGLELADYTDEYRSLYYQHNDVLRCYGDPGKKDIILPIQALKNKYKYKIIHHSGKSTVVNSIPTTCIIKML